MTIIAIIIAIVCLLCVSPYLRKLPVKIHNNQFLKYEGERYFGKLGYYNVYDVSDLDGLINEIIKNNNGEKKIRLTYVDASGRAKNYILEDELKQLLGKKNENKYFYVMEVEYDNDSYIESITVHEDTKIRKELKMYEDMKKRKNLKMYGKDTRYSNKDDAILLINIVKESFEKQCCDDVTIKYSYDVPLIEETSSNINGYKAKRLEVSLDKENSEKLSEIINLIKEDSVETKYMIESHVYPNKDGEIYVEVDISNIGTKEME